MKPTQELNFAQLFLANPHAKETQIHFFVWSGVYASQVIWVGAPLYIRVINRRSIVSGRGAHVEQHPDAGRRRGRPEAVAAVQVPAAAGTVPAGVGGAAAAAAADHRVQLPGGELLLLRLAPLRLSNAAMARPVESSESSSTNIQTMKAFYYMHLTFPIEIVRS